MTVSLTWEPTGKVAWLTLDSPPGNILDKEMMTALSKALLALEAKRPWAVVMRGEGENFCYGASVEEHLPDRVDDMLFTFTELLRQMVHFPAVTIASARGLCLGGGLELALGCDRIVLHTKAKVGLPEIRLGVFPPAGLALLPLRAGDGAVADLVISGRMLDASDALARGIVDEVSDDPDKATSEWIADGVLRHSRASLRVATDRMRMRRRDALERTLPSLNRLYLRELAQLPDSEEGIRAFLERREPAWDHTDFLKR